MKTVVCIVGPTAVGKTAVAVSLARMINSEIISCDSMQMYKELSIITSKPSVATRKKIRHHLLDCISIEAEYNVARYFKDAQRVIQRIHTAGKIPLITGGSGLYMSVLLDGIFSDEMYDPSIRDNLYAQAKEKGSRFIYQRLQKVDREAAEKIHPHDLRRIARALEVFIATKTPISKMQKQRKGISEKYSVMIFGLRRPREELYSIINKRVEMMMRKGAITEVKKALKKPLSLTASKLIGIKEIQGYLQGASTKEEMIEQLQQSTRRLAKKQGTWFRKDKRIQWIDISVRDTPKRIAAYMKQQIAEKA
ncbi:tRNA (adenosine(37)-N6)-dimethylallyltransferase MiaA [Candidatus Omnitrophota bacterium]